MMPEVLMSGAVSGVIFKLIDPVFSGLLRRA